MAVTCVQDTAKGVQQAVCIETKRIFDSFRDKDCLQDFRVFVGHDCQEIINNALSVKAKSANVLWVYIDIDELSYNTGYFTVTLRYFIKVTVEVTLPGRRCCELTGLTIFEKKAVMYGARGGATSFCSSFVPRKDDIENCRFGVTNLPEVCVDVVEPVVLDAKIVEVCDPCGCNCGCGCGNGCGCGCNCGCGVGGAMEVPPEVPEEIAACVGICEIDCNPRKRLLVSLGLFSVVRISRNTQLLIPVFDICIPQKESENVSSTENPCDIFSQYIFPTDEFFPPALTTG